MSRDVELVSSDLGSTSYSGEAGRPIVTREMSGPRLESVDLLRGLVIVLMALDHTRDFFTTFGPVDFTRAHPALVLTRWITHFCAPVFVFLAGTGAFLSSARGRSTRELSLFLLTRGLWLALLELTYVNWLGWQFHINVHVFGVQVIWAIGCSMIALAGLVWLPRWSIMTFGLAMIALHNTLDGLKPGAFGVISGLWRVLHAGGRVDVLPGVQLSVGYPLIPWIGVMAAGYAFGPLLLRDDARRRSKLLLIGVSLTLLFVVVRGTNFYGDPAPWSAQRNGLYTLFSFLNCAKYPPSLCYLLMTLGPAMLVLWCFDRGTPDFLRPLLVFGRVPLFFYLLHLPLIHGLSMGVRYLVARYTGQPVAGFGLPSVYFFWIVVVLILYPACCLFSDYKRNHRSRWLSYL